MISLFIARFHASSIVMKRSRRDGMINFEMQTPTKIIFGREVHKQVGEIVKKHGFKKVLLVYGGQSIKKTGLYDEIVDSLHTNGIRFVEKGGVQANPTLSFCREIIEFARPQNVDFILAVGGGSVIDTGKMVAHSIASGLDPWAILYEGAVVTDSLPVGCVPTIAAAGSESSENAVLTNEELGFKAGCTTPFNRPIFSILNPELAFTVPPYQIACGIVDIMMHTMERYIALNGGDNDLTDRMAEGLLKAVIRAGRRAMDNPCDYDAQATLLLAAGWSHNGMMNAGRSHTMAAHTIEHGLSGLHSSIAHGAGLAIVWPAYLKYIYRYDMPRFVQYAVRIWNCEEDFANPERTILEGIKATETYFASLNMPLRLSDVRITEKDIDALTEKCTNYGKRTLDTLISLGKNEIADIYRLCL